MNTTQEIPESYSEIPAQAVSVYGQADSAYEDFPVLKAFQQYIDAEQSKARRRMLMLSIFFSVLMVIVIAVFLVLLFNVGRQNQSLNDRLVEYAMKERERASAQPIVVQQPQQDNSAMLAITAKLDEMQKKLDESQAAAKRAEEAANETAKLAAKKPTGPTPEELEIERLKAALLAAEKEKLAAEKEKLASEKEKLATEKARRESEREKERQHQIELEKYRREHYPELYEKKEQKKPPVEIKDDEYAELMKEVDDILDENSARTYFDEEKPVAPSAPAAASAPAPKEYAIPVDIRGSRSQWSVPND